MRRLKRALLFQEPHVFSRGVEIEEVFSQGASHLPGDAGDRETRRVGELFRLRDAVAPFARGLDRDVEGEGEHPGRRPDVGIAHVLGRDAERRIWALASTFDAGLRDAPLRAGDVQIRVIIEGDERERCRIPCARRPGRDVAVQGGLEVFFESGIRERARFERRRGLRCGEGLRAIGRARRYRRDRGCRDQPRDEKGGCPA